MSRLFLALVLSGAGCSLQKGDWGLGAIRTMETPPDPPGLGCGITLPPEALVSPSGCVFPPGSRSAATLLLPTEAAGAIPIRHVLVVMKENRSFDHLLGGLASFPADFSNPDPHGSPVLPFHADTTCNQRRAFWSCTLDIRERPRTERFLARR